MVARETFAHRARNIAVSNPPQKPARLSCFGGSDELSDANARANRSVAIRPIVATSLGAEVGAEDSAHTILAFAEAFGARARPLQGATAAVPLGQLGAFTLLFPHRTHRKPLCTGMRNRDGLRGRGIQGAARVGRMPARQKITCIGFNASIPRREEDDDQQFRASEEQPWVRLDGYGQAARNRQQRRKGSARTRPCP